MESVPCFSVCQMVHGNRRFASYDSNDLKREAATTEIRMDTHVLSRGRGAEIHMN